MTTNSDYFDLSNWKITLPVDKDGKPSGRAIEVKDLIGYEEPNFFYDASDGAMVFRASHDGATTKGSTYVRAELREMDGDKGAKWTLDEGGTMSATLKVDEMPTKFGDSNGRIMVGQIHGEDDELVRLYYEEDGSMYFRNEHSGDDDDEYSFYFYNDKGEQPHIDLGEEFSYVIDARGDTLTVNVFADGEEYISVTPINDVWQSDTFYFKAGLYMGVKPSNGSGDAQVSFYGLDLSHTPGQGLGAWQGEGGLGTVGARPVVNNVDDVSSRNDTADDTPDTDDSDGNNNVSVGTPAASSDALQKVNGDSGDNILIASDKSTALRGREGNDTLTGSDRADELWGNNGDDILVGGGGSDMLKGGDGADIFAYNALHDDADSIIDFRDYHNDKIDLTAMFENIPGITPEHFLDDSYVQIKQIGDNVKIYIDLDGAQGGEYSQILLATAYDVKVESFGEASFIIPDNADIVPPPAVEQATEPAVDTPMLVPQPSNSNENLQLSGDDGNNSLVAGRGDDVLKGRDGDDMLIAGNGDDDLWGNDGDDVMVGGSGNDTLKGGDGADTFTFSSDDAGIDIIRDFRASDNDKIDMTGMLDGATGVTVDNMFSDDFVTLKQSGDIAELYVDIDGSGTLHSDTLITTLLNVDISNITANSFILPDVVKASTPLNVTDVSLFADTTDELNIRGDYRDNVMYGGHGDDVMKGRDGDDILHTGAGDDYIQGNDGDDILIGGAGADTLKGGSGNDIYRYEALEDGGDLITEYREGEAVDISILMASYLGDHGMSAQHMIDEGFILFSQPQRALIELSVDVNGAHISGGETFIASIMTQSDYEMTESDFIV